jgi:hypothetical protein
MKHGHVQITALDEKERRALKLRFDEEMLIPLMRLARLKAHPLPLVDLVKLSPAQRRECRQILDQHLLDAQGVINALMFEISQLPAPSDSRSAPQPAADAPPRAAE